LSPATRLSLSRDFAALGVAPGDDVFVHAALRALGPVVGGADTVLDGLRDAVGETGTVLGYCDWQLDEAARDDPALRPFVPPFDPLRSRAIRDNGFWPELLRTTPGALRSASPGASCAAIGARAAWYVADHALDYGYGPASPFARLAEAGGKVLMLGAPLDTMTLLHHAEHLADIPNKRVIRYEAPILVDGQPAWRWFEEFDTSQPVVEGLADDYFAEIVTAYLASGEGHEGQVGAARAVLVSARPMLAFAVSWLERRCG
jgi:aminoglycoside 3-N-acetyltransferase